ncbi:MAG: FAD-dependent oxidoreductase, partial [Gammaproteobacteria bacterium]|nr:FAD-dependent oxidoreductase [Gammaproteobacteria bacterium]
MRAKTDVLIVGGGIIGLMTARELLSRGRKVIVVDKGPAGLEASHAASGILSPMPPWDAPSAIVRLTRLSLNIYPS